ncbi:hypothetical protein B0H10DRAFT_1962907 [Mycena sp. CBHHK59/15]|nr:hypothetical protein B0H10DRAFT_1962907 [Mycena sp. CBHHK59/15]
MDMIREVTGQPFKLAPFDPDAKCWVIILDGEVPQVQGFGDWLVTYNDPVKSGISSRDPLELVLYPLKTCINNRLPEIGLASMTISRWQSSPRKPVMVSCTTGGMGARSARSYQECAKEEHDTGSQENKASLECQQALDTQIKSNQDKMKMDRHRTDLQEQVNSLYSDVEAEKSLCWEWAICRSVIDAEMKQLREQGLLGVARSFSVTHSLAGNNEEFDGTPLFTSQLQTHNAQYLTGPVLILPSSDLAKFSLNLNTTEYDSGVVIPDFDLGLFLPNFNTNTFDFSAEFSMNDLPILPTARTASPGPSSPEASAQVVGQASNQKGADRKWMRVSLLKVHAKGSACAQLADVTDICLVSKKGFSRLRVHVC